MRTSVVFHECDPLDFHRAGNLTCEACGKEYSQHPYCGKSQLPTSMSSSTFPQYFIHVLCDGTHVKL